MVLIRAFNSHPRFRVHIQGTLFIARYVLKIEKIRRANINIIFIGGNRMTRLNGTFLNKWNSTDVLSFPLDEKNGILEGEVYIDLDRARRQARDLGVTYKCEYARLIIHGLLHLTGYRDDNERRRKQMVRCEDSILNKLESHNYTL